LEKWSGGPILEVIHSTKCRNANIDDAIVLTLEVPDLGIEPIVENSRKQVIDSHDIWNLKYRERSWETQLSDKSKDKEIRPNKTTSE
jgi:hypothetical protein